MTLTTPTAATSTIAFTSRLAVVAHQDLRLGEQLPLARQQDALAVLASDLGVAGGHTLAQYNAVTGALNSHLIAPRNLERGHGVERTPRGLAQEKRPACCRTNHSTGVANKSWKNPREIWQRR
jgi:hypothetical protein